MNNTLATLLPLLAPASQSEWLDLGDHQVRFALTHQQTDSFLLVEVKARLGSGVPPHIHGREDEVFHILEGQFAVEVGDQNFQLGPGDSAVAPRDLPHTWRCISPEGGRALAIISPGDNFESFAFQMSAQRIMPGDPATLPLLLATAREHDITMLPPR